MSIVTYSASPGTVNNGLNNRSNRALVNGPGPGPSAAFGWNAAFEEAWQEVLLVVHGTWLAPPAWEVVQPEGNAPGATSSKFSRSRVVACGVPVNKVCRRVR